MVVVDDRFVVLGSEVDVVHGAGRTDPQAPAPIVEAFDIEIEGEDGQSVVIDVTSFYEGDTPALTGLSSQQRSTSRRRRRRWMRSTITCRPADRPSVTLAPISALFTS